MSNFLIDSYALDTGLPTTAAEFDGTNDYYETTSSVGNDSKQLTMSFWIKMNGKDAADLRLYSSHANNRLVMLRTPENKIRFIGRTIFGTDVVDIAANTTTVSADGNWHHVFASIDATVGVERREIFIDGLNQVLTETSWNPANISVSNSVTRIGANAAIATDKRIQACLYEFWFSSTVSIDGNSGLGKFYSEGAPVDLGKNGELPTGTLPNLYFPNGRADDNRGTGPSFVEIGEITDCQNIPV